MDKGDISWIRQRPGIREVVKKQWGGGPNKRDTQFQNLWIGKVCESSDNRNSDARGESEVRMFTPNEGSEGWKCYNTKQFYREQGE